MAIPRLHPLAALLLISPAIALAAPVVTDLGDDHLPQAVSDDGAVVTGLLVNYDGGPGPVGVSRWTAATGTQPIGGLASGRPDVSADGSVIAGTVEVEGVPQAAFHRGGAWHTLLDSGLIPAPPGWSTEARGLSANGERLAGATTPPPVDFGRSRGFSFNPDTWEDRWADYGWQELPYPRKGSLGWASGISDDGLVQVGTASDIGGALRAVRWRDGRVESLVDSTRGGGGALLGGESVRCDRDCTTIVGGGGGSSAVQPVLAWRLQVQGGRPACHIRPLSGPPLEALRYYAYDTSDGGGVIAGAYYYNVPEGGFIRNVARGFLFTGDADGGTVHDLHAYLAGQGVMHFDGWENVVPTGLSADGRYLVGWGDDAEGDLRGWRIDFGAVPLARGPAADRTDCPRLGGRRIDAIASGDAAVPAGVAGATAASAGTIAPPALPAGDFAGSDGRRVRFEADEARLVRVDGRRRVPLLALGGDHYYDAAARVRWQVVRDRSGAVVAVARRAAHRETLLRPSRRAAAPAAAPATARTRAPG